MPKNQYNNIYKNSFTQKNMINKKEIINILIITLILSFGISLISPLNYFLIVLGSIFAVILINVITKKIIAHFLDSEIEVNIWEFKRFGYRKEQHFKKAFPAGAFFPLISRILFFPFNGFIWMASLVFEVKSKTYRAAKRHGLYSYSEMTENHIGLIAASGIFANLVLALLGYLIGFTDFARFNIWFAFWNMIPISNLDGNKIFFGNLIIWVFLACLTLLALGYTFLLV